MNKLSLICLLCFLATPALAYESLDGVTYSRTTISIESKRLVAEEKEEKTENGENAVPADKNTEFSSNEKPEEPKEPKAEEEKPKMRKVRYDFDVDMRPLADTRLDWLQQMSAIPEGRGILLTMEPTRHPPIEWDKIIKKIDIIYIRPTGKIDTILPSINGETMTELPDLQNPIRAVLYLKAGTVDEFNIRPGDRVIHGLFSPAPRVLQ